MLEGELTVRQGGEVVTAGPGEIIVKPRGIFHAFWNAGEEPLRLLEVISPGGFEDYFVELADLIPPDRAPDLEALAALAARYGMVFDLARIPEFVERYALRLS